MDRTKQSIAGYKMHKIRDALCITQEGMGDILGVSRITYRKWEQGGAVPNMFNRRGLMDWFNIKVYEESLGINCTIIREDFFKESPYGQVKEPLNLDK